MKNSMLNQIDSGLRSIGSLTRLRNLWEIRNEKFLIDYKSKSGSEWYVCPFKKSKLK